RPVPPTPAPLPAHSCRQRKIPRRCHIPRSPASEQTRPAPLQIQSGFLSGSSPAACPQSSPPPFRHSLFNGSFANCGTRILLYAPARELARIPAAPMRVLKRREENKCLHTKTAPPPAVSAPPRQKNPSCRQVNF